MSNFWGAYHLRKAFLKIAAALLRTPYNSLLLQQEYSKPRKLLKKEILRLIAALLGCPYDALVQRNKRYLYQRLLIFSTVIAAFLLFFAAVVIHKNRQISDMNVQIQDQLEKTQLSESEVLTLISRQQLENGDRMAAIRSALAALPSEQTDRPYYPQAANALAEALDLYSSGSKLTSHSLLEISGSVIDMAISNDGNFAAFLNDGDILQYYSITNGTILWSNYHNENPLTDDEKAELSYLPQREKIDFLFLKFSNDGSRIIHATPEATCVLSAATGEHIYTLKYPRTLSVTLSSDDRYLAIYGSDGFFTFYDFQSGEILSKTDLLPYEGSPYRSVEQACFSGSSNVFLAVGYDSDSYFEISSGIPHLFLLDPITGNLIHHSIYAPEMHIMDHIIPLSGDDFLFIDEVWQGETNSLKLHTSTGEITCLSHYQMEDITWTAVNDNYYLCVSKNTAYLFELQSGRLLYEHHIYFDSTAGNIDDDNNITFFCKNGTIMQYSIDTNENQIFFSLINQLENAKNMSSIASPRKGNKMYCILPGSWNKGGSAQFISTFPQKGIQPLPYDLPNTTITVLPSGSRFEVGYGGLILDGFSLDVAETGMPPDDGTIFGFSGYAADETKKIFENGILYDTLTGSSTQIELWHQLPVQTKDYAITVTNSGQNISYNEVSYGWNRILTQEAGRPLLSAVFHDSKIHWWLDDIHYESSPCPFTERMRMIPETSNVFVGENGLILLRIPSSQTWSIDHFTGSAETEAYVVYSIDEDTWYWLDYPFAPDCTFGYIPTASQKWIVCMDKTKTVYFYDPSAASVIHQFQVPFSAESVNTMHFIFEDSVMIVILNNGYTYFIDTAGGNMLGDRINIGSGTVQCFYLDTAGQRLFLKNAMVDTENWTLICNIPELRGYLSATNQIIFYDDFGKYCLSPAYSVEEMIEIARETVG